MTRTNLNFLSSLLDTLNEAKPTCLSAPGAIRTSPDEALNSICLQLITILTEDSAFALDIQMNGILVIERCPTKQFCMSQSLALINQAYEGFFKNVCFCLKSVPFRVFTDESKKSPSSGAGIFSSKLDIIYFAECICYSVPY